MVKTISVNWLLLLHAGGIRILRSVPHSNHILYHARGSEAFEFFCNNICVVYNGYGTIFVIVSNDLLQRGTARRRQFSEALVI